MTKQSTLIPEMASWLEARGVELEARLRAVREDQAHTRSPLSLDSEDRATERENDDVLEAIAVQTESELLLIRQALGRIAAGTFGQCLKCGSRISEARLRAIPYAIDCSACAKTEQEGST